MPASYIQGTETVDIFIGREGKYILELGLKSSLCQELRQAAWKPWGTKEKPVRAGSRLKNMGYFFSVITNKAWTCNKGSKVFVVLLSIFIFLGTSPGDQIIHLFFHSLIQLHIHSFNNQHHFLDTYVVLGTVLGARMEKWIEHSPWLQGASGQKAVNGSPY